MSRFRPAGLSDEHALIADLVDELVEARIEPVAEVIDQTGELDAGLATELDQHGLLAIDVDAERGGAGADLRATALAISGLARGSAAVAALPAVSHAVAAACVAGDGPAGASWAAGGGEVAFADTASGAVTVEGRSLSGRISGVEAPLYPTRLLLAFELEGGPVAALLDVDREGLAIGPVEERTGLHGNGARSVELDGVTVSGDDLVGGERAVAAARAHYLLSTAARANGVARAALDAAVSYLDERRQFGVRLADMAGLRAIAAADASRLALAEAAVWELAGDPDALVPALRGAPAKVAYGATELAITIATDALQLHGGYGYTHDFPVERHLRDAVSLRALAGGSRPNLDLAATGLLGPALV